MAFQLNNAVPANGSNVRQFSDGRTKASGFLNLYLPNGTGGRKKIGSIPLRMDKPVERSILDKLNSDEAALGRLLQALELDYQPYNEDDASNDVVF